MFKFSMEAYPQTKYDLVVHRKEGHILSYHVQQRPKVLKNIYSLYSKIQLSKQTQTENFKFWGFLETNKSVEF